MDQQIFCIRPKKFFFCARFTLGAVVIDGVNILHDIFAPSIAIQKLQLFVGRHHLLAAVSC